MYLGMKIETLSCGIATIIEILGKGWCTVEFEDGFRKRTSHGSIRDKMIKNPHSRSVYGLGVLGEGYNCTNNGVMTKEYSYWIAMMSRCYHNNETLNVSYADKYVSEDWLFFQNFAEWCQTADNFNMGWQLDKDLLIPENKIYSSETCTFLPVEINAALSRSKRKKVQDLPLGVTYNSHNKRFYVSYYDVDKGKNSAKPFKTSEDAENFYLDVRYTKLKIAILKYKDLLKEDVLCRLCEIINN